MFDIMKIVGSNIRADRTTEFIWASLKSNLSYCEIQFIWASFIELILIVFGSIYNSIVSFFILKLYIVSFRLILLDYYYRLLEWYIIIIIIHRIGIKFVWMYMIKWIERIPIDWNHLYIYINSYYSNVRIII